MHATAPRISDTTAATTHTSQWGASLWFQARSYGEEPPLLVALTSALAAISTLQLELLELPSKQMGSGGQPKLTTYDDADDADDADDNDDCCFCFRCCCCNHTYTPMTPSSTTATSTATATTTTATATIPANYHHYYYYYYCYCC